MIRYSACAFIFLFCVYDSAAQSGGPPMLTDDPGTVSRHCWEINTSFNSSVSDVKQFEAPLLDVNYGFREGTQFKAEMPFVVTETEKSTYARRTGSPLIGVKQRLVDEATHFISVSTYPQWLISIHVEDAAELKIPLQLEKTIGRFLAGAETGVFVSAIHSPDYFIGMLAGYKFSGRMEVMAEWYIINANNSQSYHRLLNAGLRYAFSKRFVLLASAGTEEHTPAGEARETFFSYTGLQVRLGKPDTK